MKRRGACGKQDQTAFFPHLIWGRSSTFQWVPGTLARPSHRLQEPPAPRPQLTPWHEHTPAPAPKLAGQSAPLTRAHSGRCAGVSRVGGAGSGCASPWGSLGFLSWIAELLIAHLPGRSVASDPLADWRWNRVLWRQLQIYSEGRCCFEGSRGEAVFCTLSSAPPGRPSGLNPLSSPDADGRGMMPQPSPVSLTRSK